MSPLKNTRLAWSVAVASLALWAFSAPISWGQVASGAARLFDVEPDEISSTPSTSTTTTTTTNGSTSVINVSQSQDNTVTAATGSGDASADSAPCAPQPAGLAQVLPTLSAPAPPPAASAAAASNSSTGTFRVCGPDPQAEQAIAQLIAGRGFSATLSARNDGCADLTIRVTSPVAHTSGTSSTNLNVSVGAGKNLSIKIASDSGATRVSIGSNQS